MSIKKSSRYLILRKVDVPRPALSNLNKSQQPNRVVFSRRECTGDEALTFLQSLQDASGYEIYELKGAPLVLQTTVVVAKAEDVDAAADLKDFPEVGDEGGAA